MSKSRRTPGKTQQTAPLTAEQIRSLDKLNADQAKAAISALECNPHLGIPTWYCRADWVIEADGSPVSDEVWEDFIGSLAVGSDLDFALEETGMMRAPETVDTKETAKE